MASRKPRTLPTATVSSAVAQALREQHGSRRFIEPRIDFSALGTNYGPVVPGAPEEPVFSDEERAQIQGNVIPGFNKPHQHFLFLRFGDIERGRGWLRELVPQLTSLDQALAFVRAYRSRRGMLGEREVGMFATWLNVAFSSRGLAKLLDGRDVTELREQSFHQGMAARSTYLGDPSDAAQPGHQSHWVVGGATNEADLLVILASDLPDDLERRVADLRSRAADSDLELIFEQRGDVLPGDLQGHEHFGFRDGISQPAVRGRASSHPQDFLVPRYMDPSDPERAKLFAKPGQPLVWPGQFVIGMTRQAPNDLLGQLEPLTRVPAWARHGSFVVCRRLRQDVPAFWSFVETSARRLGIPRERLAAMLVGRWTSGAPLSRAVDADDPSLAADELANNHFLFDADTRAAALISVPGYAGDEYPRARADLLGQVCPHFAHVRKMNPRDSATEMGPHTDTLLRMLLRRGIPYGPPIVGVERPSKKLLAADRGLMFLSYGSSIEEQFEFLQRRWANSPLQPNLGGPDPVIGQADRSGDRRRRIQFPTPTGPVELTLDGDWVIPTGGGYFFSPAIGAVLGLALRRIKLPGRFRFYQRRDWLDPRPPPVLPPLAVRPPPVLPALAPRRRAAVVPRKRGR